MADAVGQEVHHDPRQLVRVGAQHPALDARVLDADLLRDGELVDVGDGVGHDVQQLDVLRAQPQRPALDLRQREQVVDQPVHRPDLGPDAPHVVGRVGDGAVVQRLREGADPGERRPQVVRDPGEELPARGVELLDLRAGRGEPLGGDGELGGEVGELLARVDLRTDDDAVSDALHRLPEPGERPAHGPRGDERRGEAQQCRQPDHPQHHLQVVQGQVHQGGDRHGRADDGGDRGDHQDDERRGDRALPAVAQDQEREHRGHRGAHGGGGEDEQQVTGGEHHAAAPTVKR